MLPLEAPCTISWESLEISTRKYLVPGALFPGLKLPGREADHSPAASAEVKNKWIYTSTPLHIVLPLKFFFYQQYMWGHAVA
jgi:hypothetical protein